MRKQRILMVTIVAMVALLLVGGLAVAGESSAKVPGTDAEKMSKSYNNTLDIFDPVNVQRKKIMRIVTDSRPMDQPKQPETDHLFQLYSLLVDDARCDEMAALYRRGGFGYGEVKKAVADAAAQYFADARARRSKEKAKPKVITTEAIAEDSLLLLSIPYKTNGNHRSAQPSVL